MPKAISIRRVFHRFFPRKAISRERALDPSHTRLNAEQRQQMALQLLAKGELALLQGNLAALGYFAEACELDSQNAKVWLRQALAFFEYGSREGKEKTLLLAAKYFKLALNLDSTLFEGWNGWGCTLLQLGKVHEEHHFYTQAREKFENAILHAQGQSSSTLAELYWDAGVACSMVGTYSGEALDLRSACRLFQQALEFDANPPSEFWNDCASSYSELGLLLSDQQLLEQAAEMLELAVRRSSRFVEGWESLGGVYGQMYLNSMDERFAMKASNAYAQMTELDPQNGQGWLRWAELLAETGRLNNDMAAIKQSVETCKRAVALNTKEAEALVQLIESLSSLGVLAGEIQALGEAKQTVERALKQFPCDPDVWYAHGLCLMAYGHYFEDPNYVQTAIEKLQYSLSCDRTNPEVWHALGNAHKQMADLTNDDVMVERAARFFTKALDLKPHCPSLTYDAAIIFLDYSETFDESVSLDYSLYLFESLLEQHPSVVLRHPEWLFGYASALNWLADFTGDQNDHFRAIECFSQILLLDPEFPRAHLRLAQNYVQLGHLTGELDHYKKGAQAFKQAARLDEENEELWMDWGLCLMNLGTRAIEAPQVELIYSHAQRKFIQAGKLGSSKAYYYLACLASLRSELPQAMELIHKAMHLKVLPPIEELLEEEWLDNLRKTSVFTDFLVTLETKLQAREQ